MNHHNLLSASEKVPVTLKTETVLLAEVTQNTAEEMAGLPSLLWEVDDKVSGFEGVYVVPPMRYNDGKIYIKLGCNLASYDQFFSHPGTDRATTEKALQDWFRYGDTTGQSQVLQQVFRQLFPTTEVVNFQAKRCVITRTPSERPVVRALRDDTNTGLVVCTGGNGYGAMCSDAVGSEAADVVADMLRRGGMSGVLAYFED